MLKIKDNVDLKELEKFGFKKHLELSYFTEDFKEIECYVSVSISDRTICVDSMDIEEVQSLYIPNLIYDLMQAGLIEKDNTLE